MCAILDANVVHKVFGRDRPCAGIEFYKWINAGSGSLVVSDALLKELDQLQAFKKWRSKAASAGRIIRGNNKKINKRIKKLVEAGSCRSNDVHVIALAQITGARFLYSDDADLHSDFGNKSLISDPRGVIYSTLRQDGFTRTHRQLLNRRTICGR